MDNKTVLLGMSGGVDSSVAALLLKEAGFQVTGVAIRFWEEKDCLKTWSKSCCSYTDIEDARKAALKLDVPFYVVDSSHRFKKQVIDYFVDSYRQGLTPNPCAVCNEKIKFRVLSEKADELGISYISTGHYASCAYDEDKKRYILGQAACSEKDQSYFLFLLNQSILSRVIFPLSSMSKENVRRKAREANIKLHNKPSSQEVCFVQGAKNSQFLDSKLMDEHKSGEVVDMEGRLIGRHKGLYKYTIGQRKGLGLAFGRPMYIVDKDIKNNRLVLGDRSDLVKKSIICSNCNWISFVPEDGTSFTAQVKIRYSPESVPARIEVSGNGSKSEIRFEEGVVGVAPGQAAVFYDKKAVIGGGWIEG